MNKHQFKAYRHTQRICCDPIHGYPYGREDYFNRVPLQTNSGSVLFDTAQYYAPLYKAWQQFKQIDRLSDAQKREAITRVMRRNISAVRTRSSFDR